MRWPLRMALRWIALAGAATFATGAAGDVYFRDASIEISGSGTRSNCKVVLLPAQTLGEAQAPRLTLLTVGLSRLSFDVDSPAQYGSVTVVQKRGFNSICRGKSVERVSHFFEPRISVCSRM